MRWDPFFSDLESQLAAEWAAERAALDTETERLRVARLTFHERMRGMIDGEPVRIEFADADPVDGAVTAVGADWVALDARAGAGGYLVPLASIGALAVPERALVRSARADLPARSGLAERMPLGFVLRDLARRRVAVRVHRAGRLTLTGTLDRAGADHVDLACHDPGEPRRRAAVAGFRILMLDGIRWIGLDVPIEP